MRRTNQYGYVALLTVLIAGAIATAVALLLLVNGSDSLRSSQIQQWSIAARGTATACAEEALQVIHDNTSFTGTASLIVGGGSCNYTVTSINASTRQVVATGSVNSVVRKIQVRVTIGMSAISVVSWQEVN